MALDKRIAHIKMKENRNRQNFGQEVNVPVKGSPSACTNPLDKYDTQYRRATLANCQTCFSAGIYIDVLGRYKNIEEIKKGDIVRSNGNGSGIVDKTYKYNDEKQLIYFMTAKNTIGITSTDDHEFYVIEGYKYNRKSCKHNVCKPNCWKSVNGECAYKPLDNIKIVNKKAIDINLYDFLLTPICKTEKSIIDIFPSKINMKYSNGFLDLPDKILLDNDFTKFVAWYIAEGCAGRRNICFCLNSDEYDIAKMLGEIAKRIFGYKYSIKVRKNSLVLSLGGVRLSAWFKKWIGDNAKNKHIPIEVFLNCDRKILLDNLVLGDGHFRRGNSYSYTTISRELAYQVRDVALSLGLHPSITSTEGNVINGVNHQKSYHVVWTLNPNFNMESFIFDGFFAQAVLKKEYVGKSNILYNFSVENDHNYIANGYLVKNCGGKWWIYPTTEYNEHVLVKWVTEIEEEESEAGNLNVGDCILFARIEAKDYFENALKYKTVIEVDSLGSDTTPITNPIYVIPTLISPTTLKTQIKVFCSRVNQK